jgi:NADPH-dependent glutamate synthase beta subunit-like oxidoreductase
LHSLGLLLQVDYGHEEVAVKWGGDPRRFNTQSKEFIVDENGRVAGVKTVLVSLSFFQIQIQRNFQSFLFLNNYNNSKLLIAPKNKFVF